MKKGVWRSKISWLFLIHYELSENPKIFFLVFHSVLRWSRRCGLIPPTFSSNIQEPRSIRVKVFHSTRLISQMGQIVNRCVISSVAVLRRVPEGAMALPVGGNNNWVGEQITTLQMVGGRSPEEKLKNYFFRGSKLPKKGFYSIFVVSRTKIWLLKCVFLASFGAKMTKIDIPKQIVKRSRNCWNPKKTAYDRYCVLCKLYVFVFVSDCLSNQCSLTLPAVTSQNHTTTITNCLWGYAKKVNYKSLFILWCIMIWLV